MKIRLLNSLDAENYRNIRLESLQKGITQEQLAKQVNVTRQTIGLIEKGEYNPSRQALNQSLATTFYLFKD